MKAIGDAAKAIRRRLRQAMAGVRLATHATVGVQLFRDGRARLTRARREWAFHCAMDRLEMRTRFDEAVLSSITNGDQYGVVEKAFSAHDVVLDVGAHIGAFSHLCHRRGSRSIHAFDGPQELRAGRPKRRIA